MAKEKTEAGQETEKTKKSPRKAIKELIEVAKKELINLTGFKQPAATGFKEEDDQLIVTIEVLEKTSIPDGMDILGTFEVKIDENGSILNYKRTDLRKRQDTSLATEE